MDTIKVNLKERSYRIELGTLRNEAMETPRDSDVVEDLLRAARRCGLAPSLRGMTASCDARLFQLVAGAPVVIFGAGRIRDAHSPRESVPMARCRSTCSKSQPTRRCVPRLRRLSARASQPYRSASASTIRWDSSRARS